MHAALYCLQHDLEAGTIVVRLQKRICMANSLANDAAFPNVRGLSNSHRVSA
jgi:hypothetical protein